MSGGVVDCFLSDPIKMRGSRGTADFRVTLRFEDTLDLVQTRYRAGQLFQGRAQTGAAHVHGHESARQLTRLDDTVVHQVGQLRGFLGFIGQFALQKVGPQGSDATTDRGEILAKTIVQIAADPALFAFTDLDDLEFELVRMFEELDPHLDGVVLIFQSRPADRDEAEINKARRRFPKGEPDLSGKGDRPEYRPTTR